MVTSSLYMTQSMVVAVHTRGDYLDSQFLMQLPMIRKPGKLSRQHETITFFFTFRSIIYNNHPSRFHNQNYIFFFSFAKMMRKPRVSFRRQKSTFFLFFVQ